ncbi:hypothetical protein LZ31DRAFT_44552 [Colletotrichum somersetense]|nr:hypothetical protein LZ31DRAFT_44552 [Colletotrichum somersetense]
MTRALHTASVTRGQFIPASTSGQTSVSAPKARTIIRTASSMSCWLYGSEGPSKPSVAKAETAPLQPWQSSTHTQLVYLPPVQPIIETPGQNLASVQHMPPPLSPRVIGATMGAGTRAPHPSQHTEWRKETHGNKPSRPITVFAGVGQGRPGQGGSPTCSDSHIRICPCVQFSLPPLSDPGIVSMDALQIKAR